jgi:DNA/RNA-binding domain of Phe-tRNA-synthetase-like protein
MSDFIFQTANQVKELGVLALTAEIRGCTNNYSPEFDELKNRALNETKAYWQDKNLADDPTLQGFRVLHEKVGRSNNKYIASPESLLNLLLSKDRFPKINQIVDIYNLISIKYKLALGAHNLDKIIGGVTLKLTRGTENFVPLGKAEPEAILPGEYAYTNENNEIVCRLEVLQCDQTKVTQDTKNLFLIIQGNPNTSSEYVDSARQEVCDLLVKYCGGQVRFLN